MTALAVMALDVGEKRIGVALADGAIKIAIPFDTIEVDGMEIDKIARVIADEKIAKIVVGYPRNQSGEATAQTHYAEQFAKALRIFDVPVVFQDESLTSVQAEKILQAQKKPYQKGDIDKLAASIFLQDYLEQR